MTRIIGTMILAVLGTAFLPVLRAEAAVRTHTVVKGDTLWDLAQYYYREPFSWPLIADANPPPDVDDPHWIYPGQVLVIPGLETPDPVEASASIWRPGPAEPEPPAPEEPDEIVDGLSAHMPSGQTGQYPALRRKVFASNWTADGKVELFDDDMEQAAATGDYVHAGFEPHMTILIGDIFSVYRVTSRFEFEPMDTAIRVQKIGEVEVKKDLGYGKWRLLITRSGDTVQLGDMLKRDVE